MRTRWTGLLLAGVFAVTAYVVPPPAQAARCGSYFKIKRSAGSKSSKRARRYARRKAWRKARRRCGVSRVAVRSRRAWRYSCRRRGKLKRCSAVAAFRCCRTKRRFKLSKRKYRKRKYRKYSRKTRRYVRRFRRSKKRRARRSKRRRYTGACLRAKMTLRGSALSKSKSKALKFARSRVYRNAKTRCGKRFVRYIGRWRYKCSRNGKSFSCSARNTIRCCRTRSARKARRRTKKRRPRKAAN